MRAEIIIPGELPALNEIIEAAKTHWGGYRAMKEAYTELVRMYCLKCPRFKKPVTVTITWITKDAKKDPDNVTAGQKFVFDGLTAAKVIQNDTRQFIRQINHNFGIDRKNPRVEVIIEEVGK